MKKILILDTGREWGGGTNSLLELLRRTDRKKYKFTALFYSNYKKGGSSDIKTELENLGVDYILLEQDRQKPAAKILKETVRALFFCNKKIRQRLIFLIDYKFRIKKASENISAILEKLKPDMLYMNNQPSSNLEGILAAKAAGIPALQHSRITARLNSFEVNAANRNLSRIICVSQGVKDDLVKQGIESSLCSVIHNGIDSRTEIRIQPEAIRNEWGVAEKDILVGTVCSLVKRKRVIDLINAIPSVLKETKLSVKFMVVGEGPEKNSLYAHAMKKKITNLIFTGFQPDAASYINAMDIFVLPSENEGLPRVVLEAMLMTKPVVAADVAGPSELVINGETGFLVKPRRDDQLAVAITELAKNPGLRKSMGEKGRQRVTESFTIEKYVSGVGKIFDEVLGN